jgi:nickel-dependent lactate racemase
MTTFYASYNENSKIELSWYGKQNKLYQKEYDRNQPITIKDLLEILNSLPDIVITSHDITRKVL